VVICADLQKVLLDPVGPVGGALLNELELGDSEAAHVLVADADLGEHLSQVGVSLPGSSSAALRFVGRHVEEEPLGQVWPRHHENANFYGTHFVDIAGELAKLDASGCRPLRAPAPTIAVSPSGPRH
jgi:hypothetical protein